MTEQSELYTIGDKTLAALFGPQWEHLIEALQLELVYKDPENIGAIKEASLIFNGSQKITLTGAR